MDDWLINTSGKTTIEDWLDEDFVTVTKIMVELNNN